MESVQELFDKVVPESMKLDLIEAKAIEKAKMKIWWKEYIKRPYVKEKLKIIRKKYAQSENGKSVMKRANAKFLAKPGNKEKANKKCREYARTEEGRAANRIAVKKYQLKKKEENNGRT